ncbi:MULTISPECIES: RICIN domain-containing protein [unclassified Lentimonas]|uniref:CBM96 family carbohydrate-binding protein n=1 Tax=unclassified Lentimonas TaxID=2630993 RepID=UPI0013899CF6|nr:MULTISPECIES: RICIN domain-containing protein [unclassified Lentimonas]
MQKTPKALLLCALISTTLTAAPPAGTFTLRFQDNFDGTKLDGSKWKVGQHVMGIEGVGGNNPNNITVSNGSLKIKATTDNVTFGNTTFNNSGGEISTFMNFNQKYGYFEARVRYPSVKGLWPAFWLMPDRETYGNLNVYNRSYLKFNLVSSGIGTVSSATIRLKVAAMTAVSAGQSNSASVFAVDDDSWKETGSGAITWNNAPTWDPRYLDQEFNQQGELSVGDFVEFDVRDFVAAEMSGDKIISLAIADTFMKDKLIEFHSSEASSSANRPRLIVNGNHYIATEDAYVNWGSNANKNYGNATRLRVRDDFGSGVASTFNGGMEIDIMEKLGVWGSNRTAHVLHWDGYVDPQHQVVGFGEIAVNNSSNYHTYGLYWEDNYYVFYIDGVQTGAWWNDRVMSTPAYILLSMQLGGSNNTPTSAIQNQVMEVDYVRAYSGQKTGGINAHEGDRKAIINMYTGKALQTPAGATGANNYADMVQNTYNATYDSQRWNVINAGSGYYQIESVRSGKALMPEGSSSATDALIEQFTWSNYNAQKWTFFKTDAPGFYRLKNKHSSKVMRPLGGSTANDAKISQVPVNGGATSQRWEVTN